jgi:hypothetical protein
VQSLATLVLLALGVAACGLAARNVFGEDSETPELAREISCGHVTCTARQTSRRRLPWGQAFEFVKEDETRAAVWCQRALWLTGPWHCELVELDGR